ncbi:ATP-binding protein [Conexibacter woesei]|uniref:histidine kinase n=1 Tax=Conexibacter woesei (strain DSM 14684 / CCUG 47730 / CIP 108061 / JCM 11494 / NBRC 100937 / ID131577) TaxID=469383 RepID=D3FDG0_CONWI|nr:ATP-binding protein [Conexibacter woesei]ADB53552.1 integral membrane sensor signal transduction histidine kinase [Conexibacter woesei DSM 14684]
MMRLRTSLAWRLALTIAAIAATLSASIGVAVYERTARDRTTRARDAQAERATLAAALVRTTGQTLPGAEIDTRRAPLPLRRAVGRGNVATFRTGGDRPFMWAGAPLSDGERIGRGVYVRQPIVQDVRALGQLRDTLLITGVAGTLIAALIGVVLAKGLSRRLQRAADVADRVAAGDYDARIQSTGRDEVARLGHAVDAMSDALAARLEREQRFAADAAHELRTPLTALTTAAELLDDGRPAQIVRERVAALRTLVADLLELAHLDAGTDRPAALESFDLVPWLDELVAERAPGATVEPTDAGSVVTDPRHLERIVGNLLDNATRHGAPPIVVRLDGDAIEVRDHGDGYPDDLLRDGPHRFRANGSGAAGSGLGLAIAEGHAAAIGARLTFANDQRGGAVARLALDNGSRP